MIGQDTEKIKLYFAKLDLEERCRSVNEIHLTQMIRSPTEK